MRKAIAVFSVLALLSIGSGFGCAEGTLEEANVDETDDDSQDDDQGNDDHERDDNGDDQDDDDAGPCKEVDCSTSEVCDPDGPECVDCLDDEDCPAETVCDENEAVCIGCTDDGDCGDDRVCDGDTCVICQTDDDCNGDLRCDDEEPACVECLDEQDCNGELVCGEAGQCIECTDDDHCDDACDTDDNICVECTDDDHCDDVCDTDDNICVECTSDGDCADLVCDDTGQTCVECVEDDDCDDAECHPDYPVCTTPCCDFTRQTFATDRNTNYGGFELVVDDDGTPLVGLADITGNDVVVATRDGGTWSYEVVDDFGDEFVYTSSHLAVDLDTDDEPHLALSNSSELTHYRPAASSWQADSVDAFTDAGSFDRVNLVVDSQNTAHVITEDGPDDAEFHYYRRGTSVTNVDELVDADTGDSLNYFDIALFSDDRPVVVASGYNSTTGDGTDTYVYDRSSSGFWATEAVGAYPPQAPSVAVDEDDQLWIAAFEDQNPVVYNETNSGWNKDIVNDDDNSKGLNIQLALDENDEPLVVYAGYTDDLDRRLYYTRRIDDDWIEEDIGDFEELTYPKFVYDTDEKRPHIVARNNADDRLVYFTLEP